MKKQNNEKIVALSFRSAKITSDELEKILKKFLALQKNRKPKKFRGKQSLKSSFTEMNCFSDRVSRYLYVHRCNRYR